MSARGKQRKKLVVLAPFPVYPPRGGGQERLYQLYRALSDACDVDLVTLTYADDPAEITLAPRLREIRVARSPAFWEAYCAMQAGFAAPMVDVSLLPLGHLLPEYGAALEKSVADSDMVLLSHPYLFAQLEPLLGDRPFVYEAQDVEIHIKTGLLQGEKNQAEAQALLALLRQAEEQCCQRSQLILTCSQQDKQLLCSLYGISPDKVLVTPNGVDTRAIPFTPVRKRLSLKRELGLAGETLALFVGSNHPPNLEACRALCGMAADTPRIKYLLMGNQCDALGAEPLPDNVGLLGMVDHFAKRRIYEIMDVALNPVESGSGTNLKMFEYFSAGIPTLATPFGGRGIDRKEVFLTAPLPDMARALDAFSLEGSHGMVTAARLYAEEEFDWRGIAQRLLARLEPMF